MNTCGFSREYLQLGEKFFAARRIEQALACYLRARQLGADPNEGTLNRWMCFMLLGKFEEAWRETDRTEADHAALDLAEIALAQALAQ